MDAMAQYIMLAVDMENLIQQCYLPRKLVEAYVLFEESSGRIVCIAVEDETACCVLDQ